MGNLRIKISLGSFNVELEGEPTDVITQLDEIKKNGLGQMVDQLVPIMQQAKPSVVQEKGEQNIETAFLANPDQKQETPSSTVTLHDVALKLLPKSESEWILIYGYFTCQDGKTSFTREDLIAKYEESNRKKASHIKNLSASIQGAANVRKGWISQLNDKDFILTPEGRKQVAEILSRTEATVKAPRKQSKNKKEENDSNQE